MCGRYSLFTQQENDEIAEIIQAISRKYPERDFRTGEIFPSQTAPVLIKEGTALSPELSVWGFSGYKGKGLIINARAETAAEKRTFRDSLLFRRCIIPSTGFYEWDAQKQKRLFRLPGEQTLYMGGIYKEFQGVRRHVILTAAANSSVKEIHDRMPVILPQGALKDWISDAGWALAYLHGQMPALVIQKA